MVASGVGEGAGAAAVGDRSAATLQVVGDGADIRGGIAVVDGGEVACRVVGVPGFNSACPCAGFEAARRGVGVAWALVGVVELAHQPAALGIVVPCGGGVACGSGGDHGFHTALGVVGVFYRVLLRTIVLFHFARGPVFGVLGGGIGEGGGDAAAEFVVSVGGGQGGDTGAAADPSRQLSNRSWWSDRCSVPGWL